MVFNIDLSNIIANLHILIYAHIYVYILLQNTQKVAPSTHTDSPTLIEIKEPQALGYYIVASPRPLSPQGGRSGSKCIFSQTSLLGQKC